jgi:type I restriction enzyme S subunit
MSTTWKTRLFSDVVDILDSRRIPVNSEERAKRPGEVPYYGATGQVGTIDTHIFDEELVLLGEDGAPFLDSGKPKAYLICGKSWVNNHAHVLRGKPGLLNPFLLYQLNTLDYRPYVSGTTRLKLPQGPMKRIPLLVPEEKEQRRIVAEIEKQFTRLEAGVAALRRVQANLKRYRAAVLKAACEGKLVLSEGELQKSVGKGQNGFESGEQLLKRILDERRQRSEDSNRKSKIRNRKYVEPVPPDTANLPPVPTGWTWASVDQLGQVGTGATPKRGRSDYYEGGDIAWVTSSALNRPFVDSADEFVTKKALAETNLTIFPTGTLLLAMYGEGKTRGKCAELRIPATTNQAIAGIQCRSEIREYLKLSLWRQYESMRLAASGGVQPNLNLSLVRAFCIPVPPLAEQTRIVAEVERRLSVVEELERVVSANLQRASSLRQSILQKAFSGKLVKPEASSSIQLGLAGIPQNVLDIQDIIKNRAAIDAYILANSPYNKYLGRTKMEKENHFLEYEAKIPLGRLALRDAAGPVDIGSRLAVEDEAKNQNWYSVVKHQMGGGKIRYEYVAGKKIAAAIPIAETFMGDRKPAVDRLIKLLKPLNTDQCSVVATLYAAWNDLLLLGKHVSDQTIITESSDNWHHEKKKIPIAEWNWGLNWLRKNNLIPNGRGKPIPPKN